MFPRRERLSRTSFPSALSGGRRVSSPHFMAVFSNEPQGYAVVVPKKVARLSVTRHLIKRRILHVLKAVSLPKTLILFPRPSVAKMTSAEIKSEIAALLSKIR